MQLTMGQAATECGVSKSTLSRAIASGKLSATRTDTGFLIDPSELFRAYPPRTTAQPVASGKMAHHATGLEQDETLVLRAENEGLKAQLATMRELADEMKRQAQSWQKQAEAETANTLSLLADTRPKRRGWFARLAG